MSIEQDREYFFLEQLAQAPNQTLAAFAGSKAKPKGLDLDGPAKKNVEARLIEQDFIQVEGKARNKKINLTESGKRHLQNRPPAPEPQINPKLKAFILMNLLAAGEAYVTLKQVKALLPPALAKTLAFSKDDVVPLLNSLVKERAIEQTESDAPSADDRTRFQITSGGRQMAMQLEQHPLTSFKLSGRILNDLIRHSDGDRDSQISRAAHPGAAHSPQIATTASQLTDDMVINEARELMRSMAEPDLLPIYELRRRIRQKYGEHVASHQQFDARLLRMFGERLRLVPISDRSRATPDQLRDGIPGADELFFYVRELR